MRGFRGKNEINPFLPRKKMNIKRSIPSHTKIISKTCYLLGIVASIASGIGTYDFFVKETGNLIMSGAAASLMGFFIMIGWNIAFTHQSFFPRFLSALIALLITLGSSYTIYQNNLDPLKQQHQDDILTQKQAQQAQLKDLQSNLKDQKDQNTNRINDLQTQIDTDKQTIRQLKKRVKTSRQRKENNAEIVVLKQQIEAKEKEKKDRFADNAKLTKQIAKTLTPKNPTEALIHTAPEFSIAMLFRASIYDIATFLLLLFASFYQSEERRKKHQTITALDQASTIAEQTYQRLQNHLDKLAEADEQHCNTLQASQKTQKDLKTQQQALTTLHQQANQTISKIEATGINVANHLNSLDCSANKSHTLLQKTQQNIQKLAEANSQSKQDYQHLKSTTLDLLTQTEERTNQQKNTLIEALQEKENELQKVIKVAGNWLVKADQEVTQGVTTGCHRDGSRDTLRDGLTESKNNQDINKKNFFALSLSSNKA